MVNELIRAIAKAIRKEFQQEPIYSEQVEQGLQEPCFFILCLSQKEQAKLDVRFLAQHAFVISYVPKGGNADCWEVQAKLQRLLEFITLDDDSVVRGTNRKGEIKEGILHFFVDYDFYMKKEKEPEIYMELLQIDEKTRKATQRTPILERGNNKK